MNPEIIQAFGGAGYGMFGLGKDGKIYIWRYDKGAWELHASRPVKKSLGLPV